MTTKRIDSKWIESIRETSDILLAFLFGVVFQKYLSTNYTLVFEVEWIIVAIVVASAVVVKKHWEKSYKDFKHHVIRGARWFIGILASSLFTIGFALSNLLLPLGVGITALFFGFVVSTIHYAKVVDEESPKPTSNKLGLTTEVTGNLLKQLFDKRIEIQKEYDELSKNHTGTFESIEMNRVRQQREAIDNKIADVRQWYELRVLEGLEEESRRLKWLTVGLIALTAILTIFTGFLVLRIPFP